MKRYFLLCAMAASTVLLGSFSCTENSASAPYDTSDTGDTGDTQPSDDAGDDTDTDSSGGEGGETDSGDAGSGTDSDPTIEDFEDRARALVAEMTLSEKVSQMGHQAPAIERLNVPAYNWWNEALHGVAFSGVATVFPQAISMASTFDPDLLFEAATVISTEARVMNNVNGKGLTYWSPTINLARDPRWGRNEETYGEDPYLASRMAVSFVRGMQGDDPVYLKTVSTVKHFVANNIEATRHTGSSEVTERNLRELYMPAFRAAVEEADVQSLMCAYNSVNGVPSCANDWMLQTVLREEWGFSGYVVSDCWAIQDIVDGHGYVETNVAASEAALAAGTDLNCGNRYQEDLEEAVTTGVIDEAALDNALVRLFRARFRLGEFDAAEDVPYRAIPDGELNSAAHAVLARRAADESMVLLKNDGLLPLDPSTISSMAVIGPNAARIIFGVYSGTASAPTTVLDGISRIAYEWDIEVSYAQGTDVSTALAEDDIERAANLAASVDAVVLALGNDLTISAEALDRSDIALPAVQESLLEAVRAANPNTVLVLVTGGPLSITWADENVSAILNAGYGGQSAGDAAADVIFGETNPAGRLPQTYYRSLEDLPPFDDYNIIEGGRTYMYFEGDALYPFGHGLSYTQFEYADLTATDEVAANGEIEIAVDVTNVGDRAGDEVVQIYAHDSASSVPTPIQKLVRFARISLDAGETRTVSFTLPASELSTFDETAGQFLVESGVFEIAAGASSSDLRLQAEVTVTP